jgi:hypothetical protein
MIREHINFAVCTIPLTYPLGASCYDSVKDKIREVVAESGHTVKTIDFKLPSPEELVIINVMESRYISLELQMILALKTGREETVRSSYNFRSSLLNEQ